MSRARLVITAVTVEKRPVSEVARSYGVARSWIYTLLARYQAEGDAAFEPRSRHQAPHDEHPDPTWVQGVLDDLRHHMVAGVGFEPTCDTRSHALSELVEEVG